MKGIAKLERNSFKSYDEQARLAGEVTSVAGASSNAAAAIPLPFQSGSVSFILTSGVAAVRVCGWLTGVIPVQDAAGPSSAAQLPASPPIV